MCRTEPCHFKANEFEAYLSKSVTLIEQLTLDTKGKEMLFTNKYSSTFQFAETLFIVKNQNKYGTVLIEAGPFGPLLTPSNIYRLVLRP